jgi:hypothetical protein
MRTEMVGPNPSDPLITGSTVGLCLFYPNQGHAGVPPKGGNPPLLALMPRRTEAA